MTVKTFKILFLLFVFVSLLGAAPSKQAAEPAKTTVSESSLDLLRADLHRLALQLSEQPLPGSRPRVAVIDFSDIQTNVPAVSYVISETLINELFKTGKYEIVERKLLSGILEQQKLNMSGLVDEATARKVGKLLGVDYIVSGTLIDLGDVLNVNARMISIETGAIMATASTDLSKAGFSAVKRSGSGAAQPGAAASLLDDLPAAGELTPWMDAESLGREMDRRWKEGYHPASVEGRVNIGRSEFRAAVQPFPKKVFWFYW